MNSAFKKYNEKKKEKYDFLFGYRTAWPVGTWELSWRVSEVERRMVELIKPGNETIENVVDKISQETKMSKEKVFLLCEDFYKEAKRADIMLLKSAKVPDFPKTSKMMLFTLSVK